MKHLTKQYNSTNVSCIETVIVKYYSTAHISLHHAIPITYTVYWIGDQFTDHCSGGDNYKQWTTEERSWCLENWQHTTKDWQWCNEEWEQAVKSQHWQGEGWDWRVKSWEYDGKEGEQTTDYSTGQDGCK